MMSASVLDWLATSLMIVGFAMLLVLTSYLLFALVAGDGGHAPEDDSDLLMSGEAVTETRYERRVWPLAS